MHPRIPRCPRCGYAHSGAAACAVCQFDPGAKEPVLPGTSPLPRRPATGITALVAGALAFPRGLLMLFSSRGVKRLMLPPFAITFLIFTGLILSIQTALSGWLDRSLPEGVNARLTLDSLDPGWWRHSLEWLLNDGFGIELLRGGSWILFAVLAMLLAWTTFSLVFELVAGPFLDELHGQLEERWFGFDPHKLRNRPTELPAATCARLSWRLGLVGAALALVGFWYLRTSWALFTVPMFLAPFAVAALPGGLPGAKDGAEYGKWLRWVLGHNTRALGASASVALVTLVLVVVFFPLNFVPPIGSLLYAGIVGTGTAIGMLDLPLERRDLGVRERLSFATHHLGPVALFGVITGAVFSVPVIGPLVAIPSASVGALWLVCRLDKGFLGPHV